MIYSYFFICIIGRCAESYVASDVIGMYSSKTVHVTEVYT